MIEMIVKILQANNGWVSIRDIQRGILEKYGITLEYKSIYQSLNCTELAEHVLKDINSIPQQYKFEG